MRTHCLPTLLRPRFVRRLYVPPSSHIQTMADNRTPPIVPSHSILHRLHSPDTHHLGSKPCEVDTLLYTFSVSALRSAR